MPTTEITLPFPPSTNHYWRHVPMGKGRGVRSMISKRGREYSRAVWTLWQKQVVGPPTPIDGDLSVAIHLHPPDRRKRDVDNYCKGLLDAMTAAGAWHDDSQIKCLQIWMHPSAGKDDARAEVTIEPRKEAE